MNNIQTRTVQVVMQPTTDKTSLKKFFVGDIYQLFFDDNDIIAQYQHLHFITNEPIKKGEWYYSTGNNEAIRAVVNDLNGTPRRDFKIVASTNASLGLPDIPAYWIKDVYIPVNGSIKEVELETTNEVKIVTAKKTKTDHYNKAVKDIKEGFLTNGREDDMIALLKKPSNEKNAIVIAEWDGWCMSSGDLYIKEQSYHSRKNLTNAYLTDLNYLVPVAVKVRRTLNPYNDIGDVFMKLCYHMATVEKTPEKTYQHLFEAVYDGIVYLKNNKN
jgi:hypothetical protein